MKLLALIIVLTVLSLSACGGNGDISDITLNNGVTFKHSTHSSQTCIACHPDDNIPGKIPALYSQDCGKQWAHNTCNGCHTDMQIGPTTCKGCHESSKVAMKNVAATVSVTSSGNKSYSVQGSGMEGVSGIQLDISYDSTSLSNPTVAQGALVSGEMLAANTTLPGSIKIAIISTKPFSANGQIATITFAGRQGNGGITYANVSMIDVKGAGFPASVSIAGGSGGSSQDLTNNLTEPTSTSTSCR